MNLVRRLLHLLLCLVLALNGAALAHAGAASAQGQGGPVPVGQADAAHDPALQGRVVRADVAADAMHADAAPCHEAPEPDASHDAVAFAAMPGGADAADAPCCGDAATPCDQACVPAMAAALLPERTAAPTGRLRSAVPTAAVNSRAPPPAHPPIRPPIVA